MPNDELLHQGKSIGFISNKTEWKTLKEANINGNIIRLLKKE